MGYHRIDPDELDPTPDYHCDRRGISDAAELAVLHVATYEMDPGEQLPRTYHYHENREEVLYVLDGDLRVETPEGLRDALFHRHTVDEVLEEAGIPATPASIARRTKAAVSAVAQN